MTVDRRRYAPAAARNREPIRAALEPYLPRQGLLLEIASGSGEHVVHLAAAAAAAGSALEFQPTDPDPDARASIDAWVLALGLDNVRPALALDASSSSWPVASADVILCINMIHIAPWQAAVGLIAGAGRVLGAQGTFFLYGPFRRDWQHTAPSNARFDADLRRQDPAWGVRDLEAVAALAAAAGFAPPIVESLPANNLAVIFRRGA